jgi:Mg/Co/Ni transporter MgtE
LDVWRDRPQVHELLKRTPLKDLMDPPPQPFLKSNASLNEVSQAFLTNNNEFFYVSDDGQNLDGIVTITDLIRGRSSAANGATSLAQFMTKNPIALAADDNCAVAATTIREYRLKNLPVLESKNGRKLLGCFRVRRLMAFVAQELSRMPGQPVPAALPETTNTHAH